MSERGSNIRIMSTKKKGAANKLADILSLSLNEWKCRRGTEKEDDDGNNRTTSRRRASTSYTIPGTLYYTSLPMIMMMMMMMMRTRTRTRTRKKKVTMMMMIAKKEKTSMIRHSNRRISQQQWRRIDRHQPVLPWKRVSPPLAVMTAQKRKRSRSRNISRRRNWISKWRNWRIIPRIFVSVIVLIPHTNDT